MEVLQSYVNTFALGSVENPGHWQCSLKNGQELGNCRYTDGQAKRVDEVLAAIIDNDLTLEESRQDDWRNVCK
jgi:hypothetical protein